MVRNLFGPANATLGYAPNNSNTGGVLTVSDGIHTAALTLLGNYVAESFAAASDGHGGTTITEPNQSAQQLLSTPHA